MITHHRTQDQPPAPCFAELPGDGTIAFLSDPAQAGFLPSGCLKFLMLNAGAPHCLNRELAEAGIPVVAVDSGETPLSADQFASAFAWCPEALKRSQELQSMCADSFPAPSPRLPQVSGDIRELARTGLQELYPADIPYDRLDRELSVISARGQTGYFLALWDLARYAREQGTPIGPGRGSAVGSLTAYALGITAVDPIAQGLYFERFLNPERPDLPDIDLDVCSLGRPRLVDYLRERYGHDRVAMVGVLATLGPRGSVREAGRRLGTPKEYVDAVARALPQDGSIADAVSTMPEFRYLDTAREPIRSLLACAEPLQGRPWHTSVHAAGVVISPEPLSDLVPLEKTGGGEIVTQYTSQDLEELGLVKIDILGLRNLTIIAETCSGAGIDPDSIPRDDARTFALLASGETLGVFQLDSPGIRNLLRQVRPETIDDLTAVLSLYRPGPSQSGATDLFCRRRLGRERVRYLDSCLEPILRETFGIILYQEQVMRLAHEVGGLSLADADQLRRDLAAGDASRFLTPFVKGAVSRGLAPGVARQIFSMLERFSGYSFNKAHTAAYAQISYVTAYLKTHHPAHYCAALLTHESGYFRPDVYLREAARLGVALLPPHINRSRANYTAEDPGSIRAGLLQIPGVGTKTAAAIVHTREKGPFRSIADFRFRMPSACLPPRLVDSLLAAGCFAGLPSTVGAPDARPLHAGGIDRGCAGQLTLFDLGLEAREDPPNLPQAPFCIDMVHLDHLPDGSQIRVAGPVITCQRTPVRDAQVGLTMLLQVGVEQVSVLVPPEVYCRDLLTIDPVGVAVEGRVQRLRTGPRILASAILPVV